MTRSIGRINLLVLCCICLVGSWTLGSSYALAAQWLAPAAADHITADWVKHIEADLASKPFKDVFAGMPADPPIPAILHLLNSAAHALANHDKQYAQLFIHDAIRILDNGVSKGWYSSTDIEPIKSMIRTRAQAALEGKTVTSTSNPRWTGYSANKPLGLTNASGNKQETFAFEDTTPSRP